MSTHTLHHEGESFYFITITCHKWLPLFEESNIYDYLPFWFQKLEEKRCVLNGYVIMPNHMHIIIYVDEEMINLNKVIANSKRFLGYEIVKRLKLKAKFHLLKVLQQGVQSNEQGKGKKHQVFRLSFDAKQLDEKGVERALDYIHHNPVSGKWNLVSDYADFKHSSARFYEMGEKSLIKRL